MKSGPCPRSDGWPRVRRGPMHRATTNRVGFVPWKPVMLQAEDLIHQLPLQPLQIEGGYYIETYRSAGQIPPSALPPKYGGPRSFMTAIYYLLTPDTFSGLHRLPSDEMFHFYLGDPVEM